MASITQYTPVYGDADGALFTLLQQQQQPPLVVVSFCLYLISGGAFVLLAHCWEIINPTAHQNTICFTINER
jgi:hypothetical protein